MEKFTQTAEAITSSFIHTTLAITGIFIATLLVAHFATRIMNKLENFSTTRPKNKLAKKLMFDSTHYAFLRHLVTGIIYFIGFALAISVIPPLRNIALSLLASSGIFALIIGFASKETFSNIISGLFIEIFRPFELGDYIKISPSTAGIVEDITLRHTVLRTQQNTRIVVPNSTMNSQIIENTSHDKHLHSNMIIILSFAAPLEKALDIIKDCLTNEARISKDPEPNVYVSLIDTHGVTVTSSFFIEKGSPTTVIDEVLRKIKDQFDTNNIIFSQNS